MMASGLLNLLLFCEVRRAGGYDSVLHPLTQVLLTSVAAIGWRPVYIPATTSPSTIQSTSDSSSVLTTILSISTYNPAAVTELFYADVEEEEVDYTAAYHSTIPADAPAPHLTTTTYRPVEKIPKPAEEVAGAPGYLDDTVDTTISPPFTLNLEITTTRITSSETATTTARILPAPRQCNTFHSPTLTFQPTVGGVKCLLEPPALCPAASQEDPEQRHPRAVELLGLLLRRDPHLLLHLRNLADLFPWTTPVAARTSRMSHLPSLQLE